MKFISCLSFIALLATTASAIATIVPRESQDFASIKASLLTVGTRCKDLKGAVDGLKSVTGAPALLNGTVNLCHALQDLTNAAKGSHCTEEQAEELISIGKEIVDDCVNPCLDKFTSDATILVAVKAFVLVELKSVGGNCTDALNSVKGACPDSAEGGVQSLIDDYMPHFNACIRAYSS